MKNLFLGLLIAFWAYFFGVVQAIQFKNKEAVAAGVAHWVVDKDGKVGLEYNK